MCADGILLLSEPDEPGFVARLRIFNPDGSEAELSGNGAREAVAVPPPPRLDRRDTFSIQTAAGEIRPTITSATTCTDRHGPGAAAQRRLSVGRSTTAAVSCAAGGGAWRFQHVQVGNPQCAIRVADELELAALDLPAIGPEIERARPVPEPHERLLVRRRSAPAGSRARIFERGVGETSASGTGATGAAVAYVLDGGDSPVTVVLDGGELEVEVGEDLHINLSGWAVPVFRGALADEFVKELHATE